MTENEALAQLSPEDRLELLAFDCELRRVPRPLIDAIWAGVDALRIRSVGDLRGRQGHLRPARRSEPELN